MANKLYAVRRGHKPGIYKTWPDAEEQVRGYNGGVHQSFSSREDAEAFVWGGTAPSTIEIHHSGRVATHDLTPDVIGALAGVGVTLP